MFHADIALRPLGSITIQTGSVYFGGSPGAETGGGDFTFGNADPSYPMDFPFVGANPASTYLEIAIPISDPFVGTVYLDNIYIQ
jgi:hypothetical protein